ncbi:hypothetical protein [Polaromonas sp. YR568]|uniref:hypothetical protein n=1 Tax=Polaromonas sp. YR568 TaxID=1855301 RepID=UPI00398C1E09
MERVEKRPKLVSFRALAFHGENKGPANGAEAWTIQLTQNIEVGLAVPTAAGGTLQAVVKMTLIAEAANDGKQDKKASFNAEYEAKFDYPAAVTEAEAMALMEPEPYQYVLVAQAFPLAMTHFRREMQSMGFDARQLPLGI